MNPAKRYGTITTETFTAPSRYGAITEKQAECFWDRSSMFSQFVDEDKSLALMYARPDWKHESYVEGTPDDPERCTEWVMVYRYYPRDEPERANALQASLDYFESRREDKKQ
jgi:hypothetical protein